MNLTSLLPGRKRNWIFPLLLLAESIYLRSVFFKETSNDFSCCVNQWINTIRDSGFIGAFRNSFSDYAPLYLHLLAIASLIIRNNLLVVKLVSWIFELVAAGYFFGILLHFKCDRSRAWILSCLFLLLPTLVINGAYWGQCDVIYASMVLASLYYILKERWFASFLFLGIAFAMKLQTVFVCPLYLLVFLFHRQTWKHFFMVPAVYLLTVVPSLFAGRKLASLLMIYSDQVKAFDPLTVNAPSVYNLFPNAEDYHTAFNTAGVYFTLILLLTFCIAYYLRHRLTGWPGVRILPCSLFVVLAMPYFLPHMHDRYFFLADVLSVLYVVIARRHYAVAVIINFASLACYLKYLIGFQMVPIVHTSFLLLLVLIFLCVQCFQKIPVAQSQPVT